MILEILSRTPKQRLVQIAQKLGLDVSSGETKKTIVNRLVYSPSIESRDILRRFKRDELKSLCAHFFELAIARPV